MNYSDLVGWFVGAAFLAPNRHKDFSAYIRDLSYSTTDRKEIAYAINGYFEVARVIEGCKWEQEVRNHLALVFKKETPSVTNEKKTPENYFHEKQPLEKVWELPYPKTTPWPSEPYRIIC